MNRPEWFDRYTNTAVIIGEKIQLARLCFFACTLLAVPLHMYTDADSYNCVSLPVHCCVSLSAVQLYTHTDADNYNYMYLYCLYTDDSFNHT